MLSLDTILLENVSAATLLELIDSQRKRAELVRVHPNGFLQLSLTADAGWRDRGLRLHVWTDEMPAAKDPRYQIHDHIFDIESYVLCGTLVNTIYTVEQTPFGDHVLIEADVEKLKDMNKLATCKVKTVQTISEGEKYTMQGYEFHTSHSQMPFTATVMSKTNIDNSRKPFVLFPKGYNPTATKITRDVDQEIGWQVIEKAKEEILKRYK